MSVVAEAGIDRCFHLRRQAKAHTRPRVAAVAEEDIDWRSMEVPNMLADWVPGSMQESEVGEAGSAVAYTRIRMQLY